MNPDKAHKKYFKKNPMGNHSEPSEETLRFMKEQSEFNKMSSMERAEIKESLARIEVKLDNVHEQTLKTNGRVNCLEDWLSENKEFISESKEAKKDTRSQIKGIGWELVKIATVGLVASVGASIGIHFFD